MLKALLIAISALGLVTLASEARSQPHHPQRKHSEQGPHPQERGTEALPLVVEAIPKPPTEAERAEQEAAEAHKAVTDQKLADYTGGLFVATLVLAGLTAGLLAVGFLQTIDTKSSIQAALRAADVAEKGLKGAHRPAVQVSAVKLADADATAAPGSPPHIEFDFHNTGAGPATMMDLTVVAKLTPTGLPAVQAAASFTPLVDHIVVERNTGMKSFSFGEEHIDGADGMFSKISGGEVIAELNFIAEYIDIVDNKYSSDTRVLFDTAKGFVIKSIKVVAK